MSAGAPAIPAPGSFPGTHAPPIGQLRVARRPGRPYSGPLRAFQPQRHTLGTPLRPLKPPSTPFPSAAGCARAAASALPACSARLFRSRRLDQQSKFDGRSRSLSGQCVHQAGVAVLDGVAGDRLVAVAIPQGDKPYSGAAPSQHGDSSGIGLVSLAQHWKSKN